MLGAKEARKLTEEACNDRAASEVMVRYIEERIKKAAKSGASLLYDPFYQRPPESRFLLTGELVRAIKDEFVSRGFVWNENANMISW